MDVTIQFNPPIGPIGPIPPVQPDDLRTAWTMFKGLEDGTPGAAQTSISTSVVAQRCSLGADVMALFWRVAIIDAMIRERLLDPWCRSGEPDDTVFEKAARAPLAGGPNDVDASSILDSLSQS